jgi:transglutaminase-like putative cysteine protease
VNGEQGGRQRRDGPRAAPPEPLLSTACRLFAYAITGAVYAWPLSVGEGAVAGALGAAAGSLAGRGLAATRARTHALLAGCAGLLGFGVLGRELLVGGALPAALLGPASSLRLGEAVVFGFGASAVGAALRLLAARRRSFAALEASAVGIAFAALVAAHRNGAIHRPYEIADPILARGGDPSHAMLAIGACAGVVIALLLLSERGVLRSLFHLAAGLGLLLLILAGTTLGEIRPPIPEQNDGLRLRDDREREAREREGRGRGGGADGPDFQDEYDQSGAQIPLAIVLLHDDYSPPSGAYYFRQEAFSQYNGRRLVAASMAGVDDDTATGFPTRPIQIASAPETGGFRTTVETTVGLLADHPRPFGLEAPIQLTPMQNPDRGRFRRTYRVRSTSLTSDEWALLGRRAFDPRWSDDVRAHYTRAPSDPRYRELAQQIVSELPEQLRDDPYAQAVAVTRWLGREGIYSLRSRHAGADDPTAHFLFGDRTGYCVHFAHAAVYLMRSLGISSRVATGYMVPESSRRGGSAILIAGQNSHAWPEMYLEGVGWVVVDVVPERSLDPPPSPADEQLQQLLAEMLRGLRPLPPDGSEARRPIAEVVASIRVPLGLGLLGLGLLAIVWGYAVKIWRRIAPALASRRSLPRVCYRAALDVLSERGVVRRYGESREAFALRVGDRAPSLAVLTARHAAAVWGGRLPEGAGEEMRAAVRALRSEMARSVPWWRRALGILHPWSWWLSR